MLGRHIFTDSGEFRADPEILGGSSQIWGSFLVQIYQNNCHPEGKFLNCIQNRGNLQTFASPEMLGGNKMFMAICCQTGSNEPKDALNQRTCISES